MKNLYAYLRPRNFILPLIIALGCSFGAEAQPYNITETFTSSGSFKVPAGVTSITVECWGGGGGGGFAREEKGAAGGGGGGGAYAKSVVSVTPGNTYSFVVGQGGAGGTKSGTAAEAGGNTTFNGTTVVAAGGAGGEGMKTNASGVGGSGGSAAASIGDTKYSGGSGSDGKNGTSGTYYGGGGGSSAGTGSNGNAAVNTQNGASAVTGGSAGGDGSSGNSNGSNGDNPGGGGGGAHRNSKNRAGGNGGDGKIIISYSIPSITTLYWAGSGSVIAATSGLDFNNASNWSFDPDSYHPSPISPNASLDIVILMDLNSSVPTNNANLTFSQALTEINNLDFTVKTTTSAKADINEGGLSVRANQTLIIHGDSYLYAESNVKDKGVQLTMDTPADNAVIIYNGNLTTNALEKATGSGAECIVYPFSNPVGTMNKGKFILRGNADLRGCGDDQAPELNKPTLLVFDGTGTQTITNRNTENAVWFSAYPVFLAHETKIGETNTPTVILTGPDPIGFRTIESLTISPNATLIIDANQKLDCDTTPLTSPGAMTMGANSTLVIKGNNFTKGYGSYNLDPTSKVIYTMGDGTTQNVEQVIYGNLELTNSDATGNATKNILNNLVLKGDLTINSDVTMNQSSYSIMRSPGGGTFTLGSNSTHKLTGTYPSGFSTYDLAANSHTEYLGGTQSVSAQNYGHLLLQNAGTKTAAGDVGVRGNITIASNAVFDGAGYNHTITGNWNNNSSSSAYTYGTSSVTFNGSSGQSIGGNYGTSFYKMVMDNTSGSGITLDQPVDIYTGLTSTGSGMKLNTNDQLTIKSTATRTAYVGYMEGNTINGKATVERYVSSHKAWRMMAVPTSGTQTIKEAWQENAVNESDDPTPGYGIQITGPPSDWAAKGFDLQSPSPSMKAYNPANNTWVGVANTNATAISSSRAYMVFVRGDRTVKDMWTAPTQTTLRTKGNLNVGTQPEVTVTPGKYSLVGNPYASPIDFSSLTRGIYIDNSFYVWDPFLSGTYGLGGYQVFSAANGWEPIPGGTSAHPSGVPNTTIQSGEAFFIRADELADPMYGVNLQIAEDAKVEENPVTFTRPNGGAEKQFFRTALTTTDNILVDANAVAFSDSYNNGLDVDDARKIKNAFENLSLKRANQILAVEARGWNPQDTIYYDMSGLQKRSYRLRFVPVNMDRTTSARLIDSFTGTETEVAMTDTTYYNFTVTNDAKSNAPGRFKVVFEMQGALPVTFVKVTAKPVGEEVSVEWKVANERNNQEYVVEHSTDGREFTAVGKVTANPQSGGNYQWTDKNPAHGNNFYRVRNMDIDGKSQLSEVVKVNMGISAGILSVYPNPVQGSKVYVNLVNQKVGNYHIRIYNLTGQTVKQMNHKVTLSNEVIPIDWPSSLPQGIYNVEIIKDRKIVEVIKLKY